MQIKKLKRPLHLKTSTKIIIAIAIFIFLCMNIVWYIGSYRQYGKWQSDMNKTPGNIDGLIVDDEGYCYSVKKPSYLLWRNGNLAIGQSLEKSMEATGDERNLYLSNSSIIIWMKHFYGGVDEVGVILVQNGMSRQIYLTDNETARYPDDQPYVDAGQDEIDKLFRKAEEQWDIELPWKN